MSAPDGYAYSRTGRALLVCLQCGALIDFDHITEHDDWHTRLTVRQPDGPA